MVSVVAEVKEEREEEEEEKKEELITEEEEKEEEERREEEETVVTEIVEEKEDVEVKEEEEEEKPSIVITEEEEEEERRIMKEWPVGIPWEHLGIEEEEEKLFDDVRNSLPPCCLKISAAFYRDPLTRNHSNLTSTSLAKLCLLSSRNFRLHAVNRCKERERERKKNESFFAAIAHTQERGGDEGFLEEVHARGDHPSILL